MAYTTFPPRVAAWLAAHHGVITTAELRRFGVGRKAVDALCRVGILVRIERGVFVLAGSAPTLLHRCRQLSARYPSGFVTGPTAGALMNLRRMPRRAELHYSVAHGHRHDPMIGVKFRQTTKLRADDRYRRDDGIWAARPTRLAFDLAANLTPLDHRSVVQQLRDRRLVEDDELVAIGVRLCHPGRRGSTTFRLTLMDLGHAPEDSHPEVILGDALLRRGVPVEPQWELNQLGKVPTHPDLAVPAVRWAVELDIHPEHRSVEGAQRDARRTRSMHRGDWQREPVSELDMLDVEGLADELADLYRERCRSLGVSPLDIRGSGAPLRGLGTSGAVQASGGLAAGS